MGLPSNASDFRFHNLHPDIVITVLGVYSRHDHIRTAAVSGPSLDQVVNDDFRRLTFIDKDLGGVIFSGVVSIQVVP